MIIIVFSVNYEKTGFASRKPNVSAKPTINLPKLIKPNYIHFLINYLMGFWGFGVWFKFDKDFL